jgi:hypothetical protein
MLHKPIEVMAVRKAIDPCGDPSAHRVAQNPSNPTCQKQGRYLCDVGPRKGIAKEPTQNLHNLIERWYGRPWHGGVDLLLSLLGS